MCYRVILPCKVPIGRLVRLLLGTRCLDGKLPQKVSHAAVLAVGRVDVDLGDIIGFGVDSTI